MAKPDSWDTVCDGAVSMMIRQAFNSTDKHVDGRNRKVKWKVRKWTGDKGKKDVSKVNNIRFAFQL